MKNLEQLVEDLRDNDSLRNMLAAAGSDEAALNAVLERMGYAVTVDDMKEYSRLHDDPSEEDLRKVAGGGDGTDRFSEAGCAFVGAGYSCWL